MKIHLSILSSAARIISYYLPCSGWLAVRLAGPQSAVTMAKLLLRLSVIEKLGDGEKTAVTKTLQFSNNVSICFPFFVAVKNLEIIFASDSKS